MSQRAISATTGAHETMPSPNSASERVVFSEKNGNANKLDPRDRAFHDWYRFVLSYPPHLVRTYIKDFGLEPGSVLLDPFCGSGTTVVEAKLNGITAVGLEANPFAHFAGATKTHWRVDAGALDAAAEDIAGEAMRELESHGVYDDVFFRENAIRVPLLTLAAEKTKLLLANSISPLPLHKILILKNIIESRAVVEQRDHLLLALAKALVFKISNLHFGPEVGVGKPKQDVSVVSAWQYEARQMANDLRATAGKAYPDATVHYLDARRVAEVIPPASIDAVITSPPYPNEKDYTRTTRLESVILGFINDKAELRALKKQLVRSNTRSVYKEDDDDRWITEHPEIHRIADAIEKRRVELGKTSGFERMYARVTKLYFGGMARHLAQLRTVLKPGAQLAYVVGDQASYLRVMIRTGELLADIAKALGYEVVRIDLFRTRLATATREQLREEVVVLSWKGGKL